MTGPKRDPQLPDVPTVRELGLGAMESVGFRGLVGPGRVAARRCGQNRRGAGRVLAQAEVKAKFAGVGAEVHSLGPTEFATFVKAENEKMGQTDP